MAMISEDVLEFKNRAGLVVCKNGKDFRSKRAAIFYYIKEKLDEGKVESYVDVNKHVSRNLPSSWLQEFSTIINQFIQETEGYERVSRGRYVKTEGHDNLKDKQEQLERYGDMYEAVEYYIEEKLSDGGIYSWSELRDYVISKLPKTVMCVFKKVLEEGVSKKKNLQKYGEGCYGMIIKTEGNLLKNNQKMKKDTEEKEVEKGNDYSVEDVILGVGEEVTKTQKKVRELLNKVNIGEIGMEDMEKLFKLKDVVIQLDDMVKEIHINKQG